MDVFFSFCVPKNSIRVFKFPFMKSDSGVWNPKSEFVFDRRAWVYACKLASNSRPLREAKEQKETIPNWELEFLGLALSESSHPTNKKQPERSRILKDTESMDWCVRARRAALRSIEDRGLKSIMEKIVTTKNKKKKNKNKKKGGREMKKKIDSEDDFEGTEMKDHNKNLQSRVTMFANGMFEERKEKSMKDFIEKLSQFTGPSDRKKEICLHKDIIDSQTAEEVLELVSETMSAVAKGLHPSPLTPFIITTAIHCIAKNMEKVSMMATRRLEFARQRDMSMLVGTAMAALPECSAQGISNVAWALAKIGGDFLYSPEMDRVAEVATIKIEEFNTQTVANIAGAFASTRHSAPELFARVAIRATEKLPFLKEQELVLLLWAFASLNECADLILDSLDELIKESKIKISLSANMETMDEEDDENGSKKVSEEYLKEHVLKFSRDQLGNMAWSYAVLNKMTNVFFFHLWANLNQCDVSQENRKDIIFASQVHIVNQCLKIEHPELGLLLKKEIEERISEAQNSKRFNEKMTSLFQKEVARLLMNTGHEWVKEYAIDGCYTVDAVLVDEKLAFEVDGPSHFSRNLEVPLGHTILKRRYIASAGWKLVTLSYLEWEELQGSFEQLEHLRKILAVHLDCGSAYQTENVA